MSTAIEMALIAYGGVQPTEKEVSKVVREFERDTGINLRGVRIASFGNVAGGTPDESITQFLVLRLESEGEVSAGALERTVMRTITLKGKSWVFAAVRAAERAG
jgi:ADP-ribose pyrophosphatase YjhB (NUDIX family)